MVGRPRHDRIGRRRLPAALRRFVDHHRAVRQGFPEVVLGLGKTPAQIAEISARIADKDVPLLVTRASAEAWEAVRTRVPGAEYHELARAITVKRPLPRATGMIAIASAGTSDLPVAEEAAVTADIMGNDVVRIYDVGVAGIHRVLAERERLASARVIIVVAGMEGALPSVVAGLVNVATRRADGSPARVLRRTR